MQRIELLYIEYVNAFAVIFADPQLTWGLQIALPTGLSKQACWDKLKLSSPSFNHISGICKNLADKWPAATMVLSRGRKRENPGNEVDAELARAIDVTMARWTKRIYILTIKVNKLIFFFASRCFLKKNKTCSPCFYRVIETLVKFWENSNKLRKQSPAARLPTAFRVLLNFHSCFYNVFITR